MLQIINISKARSNLSALVKSVKETKEPVIIVQDSKPMVVLSPYEENTNSKEEYLKKLLSIKGEWFSEKEHKKNRRELNKRFSRLKW